MTSNIKQVLLSEEQIQEKVKELAAELSREYADKDPIFVGVLKGVVMFFGDCVKRITVPCQIDFMCISKGVRLEAHDVVPEIREGIEKKDPKFLDDFQISFPIANWEQVKRIEQAGLDANYNEFCRDREIKSHYGVYFFNDKPKDM